MNKIYVVLIKAHTGLGSIARKLKGFEYTHVAVCLDDKFQDFYTFSRRKHYLPADSGFMVEKRDYYAFGVHQNFKTRVFELVVPDENYSKILSFIEECRTDEEMLFNVISMVFMPCEIYKSHNCMTFTAKIIELSGLINLPKVYYKMRLKNIDSVLRPYVYSEGLMDRQPSAHYDEYMQKYNVVTKVVKTVKLFGRLVGRMFTK